jgi:hypothetical protein
MKIFGMLLLLVLIMGNLSLTAQIERSKWEIGGGLRLNYLGLSGGMSGYRASDGYEFDLDYHEIGMDNYSPSLAIAIGGRYKKWNLAFAGSRGSYKGGFTTPAEIVRDDVKIDSGAIVDGQIDMGIYALTTTFGIIQRKHDLGVGIGFLILNMGSSYKTTSTIGELIDLGGNQFFPMPFIAIAGRLNFGKFRFAGSGGGAYFKGKKDDLNYEVIYYTFDIRAIYDFYKGDNWSSQISLGYRSLFMDMDMSNDLGWAREKDIYSGPYISIRAKFSSDEKWTYVKKKDRK